MHRTFDGRGRHAQRERVRERARGNLTAGAGPRGEARPRRRAPRRPERYMILDSIDCRVDGRRSVTRSGIALGT